MKTKKFTQSKTIIGAVIVLIATLFPEIVSEAELNQVVVLSTQLVGIALAIYGRIKAETKLSL